MQIIFLQYEHFLLRYQFSDVTEPSLRSYLAFLEAYCYWLRPDRGVIIKMAWYGVPQEKSAPLALMCCWHACYLEDS